MRLRYLVLLLATRAGGELVVTKRERAHLIIGPLRLVDKVQAAVYDEGVHMACLLTETGDAISALLGSAELELEQRLVSGANDAEVVGHFVRIRREDGKSGSDWKE